MISKSEILYTDCQALPKENLHYPSYLWNRYQREKISTWLDTRQANETNLLTKNNSVHYVHFSALYTAGGIGRIFHQTKEIYNVLYFSRVMISACKSQLTMSNFNFLTQCSLGINLQVIGKHDVFLLIYNKSITKVFFQCFTIQLFIHRVSS